MRYAELIFIVIFILIGLINVIARIVVKRARKAKETQTPQRTSFAGQSGARREPESSGAPMKRRVREAEIANTAKMQEMEQKNWRIKREKMRKARFQKKAPEADVEQAQGIPRGVSEKTGITPASIIPSARALSGEMLKQSIAPDMVEKRENIGTKDLTADIISIKEVKQSRLKESRLPELEINEFSRIQKTAEGRKIFKEKKEISSWQKINKLPYLKKAFLLSEILGKPKSIERE
jgi:hypothetical protein